MYEVTALTTRTINGRAVNAIGLGCMSLSHSYGPPPSRTEGARLLGRALDLGYDHLDTARIYGLGRNETLIGEALQGRRSEFFLASKTGIIVDGDKRRVDCRPETILAAIEESLTSLKTDHIDLYYLHRPDFTVPIEDSMGALAGAVAAGKIGSIGLSEMSADTLRRAVAVHPVAAMQTEYSLWTRNPEIAVLRACAETGTTFVAFSPVGRGALADGVRDPKILAEGDMRRSMPRFNAENWPANLVLIDRLKALATELGHTPAQLSLAWVLAQAEHIVAIPGTGVEAHMTENFAASDIVLDAPTLARLDAMINRHNVSGGRYTAAMQSIVATEEFA